MRRILSAGVLIGGLLVALWATPPMGGPNEAQAAQKTPVTSANHLRIAWNCVGPTDYDGLQVTVFEKGTSTNNYIHENSRFYEENGDAIVFAGDIGSSEQFDSHETRSFYADGGGAVSAIVIVTSSSMVVSARQGDLSVPCYTAGSHA